MVKRSRTDSLTRAQDHVVDFQHLIAAVEVDAWAGVVDLRVLHAAEHVDTDSQTR